jgi:arsenical pump membrane protein
MSAHIAIWSICVLAALAILIRPRGWPEAVWAVAAALLLVTFSLLPWHQALRAVAQGVDVYLFLAGMMLLAELARTEGLFDWLAAVATRAARGSAERLFVLIYLVGTVVTILLSNDATAVVLTPAVYAAARSARAEPLPLLFVCAFIANAASFVLPISNPANLVVFGDHLPALGPWLSRFLLPSVVSILVTFVALWLTQRRALITPIAVHVPLPALAPGGRLAAAAIAATALVLLVANGLGARCPLHGRQYTGQSSVGNVTHRRREGQHVSAMSFLRLGVLVMPPALLLALASALFR